MLLPATVSFQAGRDMGTLVGSIRLRGPEGRQARFEFVLRGMEIFNRDPGHKPKITIEVLRHGELVCSLRPVEDDWPLRLSMDRILRNVVLLELVTSAVDQFSGLLDIFQFDGRPFAISTVLTPEEATWLVFRTIAGREDVFVDLSRTATFGDPTKLLALLFG